MNNKTVRRGDLYWADPPGIGRHRFLVIQNNTFNTHFDETIVVPVISKKREETNDWEVEVPEGTFPKLSIINCSAIVTLIRSELENFIGTLNEQTMQGVNYALSVTLGLESWLQ